MGISGFFGKRNLSRVSVSIEFPEEVFCRTSFPMKLTLINKRRFLPAGLIRVRVRGDEVLFPFVDVGKQGVKHMNISFGRRGENSIGEIYICSVFPFNFFTRCRKVDTSADVVVFPQPKKCEFSVISEKESRLRGEKSTDKTGYEGEVISFRDYITGDPMKYIHWKATAKTGKLKTKELSSLSQQPVVIDFDKVSIRDIEEKISCITYMILKISKQNMPVGLKIKDRLYKLEPQGSAARTNRVGMLKELALYGAE